MAAYLSYNCYFGYQFYAILNKESTVAKSKSMILLSYKNIAHIIIRYDTLNIIKYML